MTTGKTPIDVEHLVQWAIQQTGHLPWRGVSDRELMFDHGYTVIPRGTRRDYRSGGTLLSRAIDDDAALVVEAVKALPPAVAAMVIENARMERRPDWMAEPRRVPITKRHKKKHRRIVTGYKLVAPDRQAICAARGAYRQWHDALGRLARELTGMLAAWEINGFAASDEPWNEGLQKAA